MKKSSFRLLVVNSVLTFCFMIGVWTIDISVSAMNMNAIVTSGWFDRNPTLQYHLGLYLTIISFLLVVFVNLCQIYRGDKNVVP